MKLRQSQTGSVVLLVSLVVTVLLLFGALGFGVWANAGRQDYKDNVEQKVSVAVTAAKQAESTRKDQEFAEMSKSPLRTYVGPESYGSVHVYYPKTWSGYVATSATAAPYVDGYFNPDVVPGVGVEGSAYALRVRVNSSSYSAVMERFKTGTQSGVTKVSPYKLPKVPGVIGSKVTGEIDNEKKGTLIVLPLRANALEIWTESDKYLADFNKYILPNISFSP
jgi:hypothetical protein